MKRPRVPLSVGFAPIADARAHVLLLGSLPGRKSLEMHEYYAQPYNAFWRIMGALFGAEPALPYSERVERLRAHGVAVWDVLAAGERAGSLDSSIVGSTIVVNDFNGFFAEHREIRGIFFNGNTASGLYRRKVRPGLAPQWADIETHALPSTSPAYATLRFEEKLARWSAALRAVVAMP